MLLSDLCTFVRCDLLRLTAGALSRGDLGDALMAEDRHLLPLPAPCTAAVLFVTGHCLSRLSPMLHGEWQSAVETTKGLRLLTCVEALDSCLDYEDESSLFGEAHLDWPVSRLPP